MKVELLRFDSTSKLHPYPRVSWRFESIIHFVRDKPNNMTHVSLKTPRVTTIHNDYQKVEPGPPYPSAGFQRNSSTGIHGWPPHYPI
jgi:hypothetical protein